MTTYKNRVALTTTTVGSGAYTLGAAVLGYQTAVAAGCIAGEVYDYFVEAIDTNGNLTGAFEVGSGTYTVGVLTSNSVSSSTNNGAKVNWAAGTKRIALTLSAENVSLFGGVGPPGPQGVAGLAGANALLTAPFEHWEIVADARVAAEILQINIKLASIIYYTTDAAGSFSINLRGDAQTTFASLLATGDCCTVVIMNTNGATAYYPSSFSIDGVVITPKWSGGFAPISGSANSVEAWAFVIARLDETTYQVFANQTKFS